MSIILTTQILMRSALTSIACTLLAISAIGQVTPPGGPGGGTGGSGGPGSGGGWIITYLMVGNKISGQYTTPFTQTTTDVDAQNNFRGSCGVNGTVTIKAEWAGGGLAPTGKFIQITANCNSGWIGTQGSATTNDGLKDKSIDTFSPGADSQTASGHVTVPINIDSGNSATFTISFSGSATVTPINGGTNYTRYHIGATIVDKAVVVRNLSNLATYKRVSGVGAVLNRPDPNLGTLRSDTVLTVTDIVNGQRGQLPNQTFQGSTVGSWTYPLTSMSFANDIPSSGANTTVATSLQSKDLTTGTIIESCYFKKELGDFAALYNGPWQSTIQATATDGVTGYQDSGYLFLNIHSPVEATSDTWHSSYSGNLDQCDVDDVRLNFPTVVLAQLENAGFPDGMDAKLKITNKSSYTYGLDASHGGDGGIEYEIISAHYNQSETLSSASTYEVGKEYEMGGKVAYKTGLRLISVANGTANFPVVSHWNSIGFTRDGNEIVTSPGTIIYKTQSYPVQ